MFSKNASVLGKTVLSGKDSKSLRDQLLTQARCIRDIASYWTDILSVFTQHFPPSSPSSSSAPSAASASSIDRLTALIAGWLGIPRSGSCSFIAEVVQGIQRGGGTSSNDSKVWFGLWNTKEGSGSSPPILLSPLGREGSSKDGGINPNRVTLPPQGIDASFVCLSLFAHLRMSQLWQLVLAAAACEAGSPTHDKKKSAAADKKKEVAKKKKAAVSSSEEEEEEEEEDESSSSSSSSDDEGSLDESTDEAALAKGGGAIIFRIVSILFSDILQRPDAASLLALFLRSPLVRTAPATPTTVVVHAEVCDRIIRGADVMAPGTFVHRCCAPYLQNDPNCLVSVIPMGHFVPVAVGILHPEFVPPSFPAIVVEEEEEVAEKPADGADDEGEKDEGEEGQGEEAEEEEEEESDNDDEDDATPNPAVHVLFQQHPFRRGSMSAESQETRSVRVQTALGDSLWKLYEVSLAKSSNFSAWSVFATVAITSQGEPAVVSILRRQLGAAAAAAADAAPATDDGKGKKGGNKKQQQQQQQQKKGKNASAPVANNKNKEPLPLQQLRALLQEAQPSTWPAGFNMASPPQISVDNDANNSFCITPSSFAICALKLLVAASSNSNDDGASSSSAAGAAHSSSSSAAASAALTSDDIMKAASFHTLTNLTKEQLPLPLSQFGALLRASLQSTGNSGAIVDWTATRWKRPIVFLREIAKPPKHGDVGSSNNGADGIDLVNDWVVELTEQGAAGSGNFVISNINKQSRIFREHKRSTDAAHELVRHLTDQNDNNNNDEFDGMDFVATAQGKIEEMKLGFLSKRSGLAEDLDVVIFADMKADSSAAALAAAIASAKNAKKVEEAAKFPSLGDAAAAASASVSPPPMLEFVSNDEAARRIIQFARGAGLVVTNPDLAASSPSTVATGAKTGDLKIHAGPLRSLWGKHADSAPLSVPVAEVIRRLSGQLAKAAFFRFQTGQTEIRRGIPPTLQLVAKRVHNHWVTSLTGVAIYYFDPNAVLDTLKRKLACSARIEEGVGALHQPKNTVSLVMTGQHVDDLLLFLKEECGVDSSLVNVMQPPSAGKKKKK